MTIYTLLGIFSDRLQAENAVGEFESSGFNVKDISIIMKDRSKSEKSSTTPVEGVTTGIATGGLIGGLAGLLIGVGAVTLPGLGAILVGGPLAVALGLSGAAASTISGAALGAIAGGVVGALVNLGVPEHEAREYEYRIREGGILLAVPVMESNLDSAKQIMTKYQADMIRSVPVPVEISRPALKRLDTARPLYETHEMEDKPISRIEQEKELRRKEVEEQTDREYQTEEGEIKDQYRDHPRSSVEETLNSWGENIRSSFRNLVK